MITNSAAIRTWCRVAGNGSAKHGEGAAVVNTGVVCSRVIGDHAAVQVERTTPAVGDATAEE